MALGWTAVAVAVFNASRNDVRAKKIFCLKTEKVVYGPREPAWLSKATSSKYNQSK